MQVGGAEWFGLINTCCTQGYGVCMVFSPGHGEILKILSALSLCPLITAHTMTSLSGSGTLTQALRWTQRH